MSQLSAITLAPIVAPKEQDERYVGINIAAGKIYLGVARCPGSLLLDDSASRMQPAQHLDDATAFRDFADRVRDEIQRLRPGAVAVVHPRRYAGWTYREAFTRVALETAVMVAAAEEGVEFRSLKQEQIAKMTKVPLDHPTKTFAVLFAERFKITPTVHWKDRAFAFAAAWTLGQEHCQ